MKRRKKLRQSQTRRPEDLYSSKCSESADGNNAIRLHVSYYVAAAVSLLTLLVYIPALRNGFVNLDDGLYVLDNLHIRSLSWGFFKWAFTDLSAGFWHPLTWLSYAVDYALWGMNPMGFHLTAILLHTINTFLVVYLAVRLLKPANTHWNTSKIGSCLPLFLNGHGVLITAGVTGLLFGLHPLHVESVAWVSERKDLLCALFFLMSVLAYTNFVTSLGIKGNQDKIFSIPRPLTDKWYLLSLTLYVFALASKTTAISLPVVLLILDWYPYRRIQSIRSFITSLLEKMPFIAFSLLISIVSIFAQKTAGATPLMESLSLSTRVIVAFRALMLYIWKMILPLNLIPFYPYPKNVNLLSLEYFLAVCLITGITAVCIVVARKHQLWLSVWAYYVITLLPMLGIIQVGSHSMADRFTYLPSIGPFLLVGIVTTRALTKASTDKGQNFTFKRIAIGVTFLLIALLSFLAFKQTQIWKNSLTLWTYAIEKEPTKAAVAYKNRGIYFHESGQFDRAIEDYNKAIDLEPLFPHAFNNRGLAFMRTDRLNEAIADFNKAIALQPDLFEAYVNRGLAFDEAGQFEKAIADYDKAIALRPDDYNVFNYRGIAFDKIGQLDKAIADYDKAVELNPVFYEAYRNRAAAYGKAGQLEKAVADYDKAIALRPDDYEIYVTMGVSFGRLGSFDKAIECFNKAIAINPNDQEAYNKRGYTYFLVKQYDRALQDYDRIIVLNQNNVMAYNARGNIYLKKGDNQSAFSNFQKACDLNDQYACNMLQNLHPIGKVK